VAKGIFSVRYYSVVTIERAFPLFLRSCSISKFSRRESEESGPEVPIIDEIHMSFGTGAYKLALYSSSSPFTVPATGSHAPARNTFAAQMC
jgi:hypothetical protein